MFTWKETLFVAKKKKKKKQLYIYMFFFPRKLFVWSEFLKYEVCENLTQHVRTEEILRKQEVR